MSLDLRKVLTDQQVEQLRKKNEEKLERSKVLLGQRWLLHSKNQVKRKIGDF